MKSLEALAEDIFNWQTATFGRNNDIMLKLYYELSEWHDAQRGSLHAAEEAADVFFMVVAGLGPALAVPFCKLLPVWSELNAAAVQRKLQVNRKRTWQQNLDGTWSHVQ